MDEPLAEGRDDRHATAGMAIGKHLRTRGVEEPEVLRRYDRLFHGPATVIETGVGAAPIIRYGHRAIGVEGDGAASPVVALGLIDRVGDDLQDQVPNAARSKHGRALANACKMIQVHDARPIVGGIPPGSP
jgi:hypothetical protein